MTTHTIECKHYNYTGEASQITYKIKKCGHITFNMYDSKFTLANRDENYGTAWAELHGTGWDDKLSLIHTDLDFDNGSVEDRLVKNAVAWIANHI